MPRASFGNSSVQVASAAEMPQAHPSEECSQEAQQAQHAAASQGGADFFTVADLDLDRRLRLVEGEAGAQEPAASSPPGTEEGHMSSPQALSNVAGSSPGQAAQQQPPRARPSVTLPAEESADSENAHVAKRTPSSANLPSPYPQREALSPLLPASNLPNQPAASQVQCLYAVCLPGICMLSCLPYHHIIAC